MIKIVDMKLKELWKDRATREIWKKLDQVLFRMADVSDKQIWFDHIHTIIKKYKVPLEKLDLIPDTAIVVGKSRFDQLYDLCCYLSHIPYKEKTLHGFLGQDLKEEDRNIKLWRCFFNEELQIQNVIIRASSFQEAFARAADYGARVYFKLNKIIPRNMTVRVEYVRDLEVRALNLVRTANRVKTRNKKGLQSAESVERYENGLIIAALGHQSLSDYSIYKYVEKKDLKDLALRGIRRISHVEAERYFVAEEERRKQKGRPDYKEPL